MFVGRIKELEFIEKKFNSKKSEILVLYGRRRIGKTELLRKFASNKEHIFYACSESESNYQLRSISERFLKSYPIPYFKNFSTWEELFRVFLEYESDHKKLLIIDEFPYLVKNNKAIPSLLQKAWDELNTLNESMIIICGSSMSFIEKDLLSEKNPLYGRTTGIYKMDPLSFDEVKIFLSGRKKEDQIKIYSILGGIPHYLKQFDENLDVEENIIHNILEKGCTLYSEVDFLLRQELREISTYNTLISVIALGNTKLNEIHQKTNIDKNKISVYLKNLIELGILIREFPVTEKLKAKANVQRGLYRIVDPYFRFWFRFILPNLSDLEEGQNRFVYSEYVSNFLNEHISYTFEDISIQHLKQKNYKKELPFVFKEIGRYWNKTDEIDIVAFNKEQDYLFGECKWRNEPVNENVLNRLMDKSSGFQCRNKYFYLFSKSGFTKKLIERSKENQKVVLVDLEGL